MNTERKEINVHMLYLGNLNPELFYGRVSQMKKTFSNFRKYLSELYEEYRDADYWDEDNLPPHPKIFHDFDIFIEDNGEYGINYFVNGIRWETDDEVNKRIEQEKIENKQRKEREKKLKENRKKREQKKIENEKHLYQELKKKYG